MKSRCLPIIVAMLLAGLMSLTQVAAGSEVASYARIAFLRPHDGDTVDYEAGYIRHLDWHRRAGDRWTWYGWSIWAGERQRWFVYATFAHTAADFDNPVSPAEDERDNIANVTPHAEFVGNAVYEFLPQMSRGAAAPTPTARLELTTVEVAPGSANAFEAALRAEQPKLSDETLWYRMVAGGAESRYVRLRPRATLAALLDNSDQQVLPAKATALVARMTVEILNLRPAMSYSLPPAQ
jgi:hypothetical protein